MPVGFPFTYDPKSNRYRWTEGASKGRLAPKVAIDALTGRFIGRSTAELQGLGDRYFAGELDLRQFQTRAAELLRTIHTGSAMIGRGGQKFMVKDDWAAVTRILEDQYGIRGGPYGLSYLAKELAAGTVTPAELKRRLAMYGRSGRLSRDEMEIRTQEQAGRGYGMRSLAAGHKHCAKCITYAALPPQSVRTIIRPGTKCDCLTNCVCNLIFMSLEDAIAKGMDPPKKEEPTPPPEPKPTEKKAQKAKRKRTPKPIIYKQDLDDYKGFMAYGEQQHKKELRGTKGKLKKLKADIKRLDKLEQKRRSHKFGTDEYRAAMIEWADLSDDIKARLPEVFKPLHDKLLAQDLPAGYDPDGTAKGSRVGKYRYKAALKTRERFARITQYDLKGLHMFDRTKDRAYANEDYGMINMGSRAADDERVLFHEMGHFFEFKDASDRGNMRVSAVDVADDFVRKRATGPRQSLNSLGNTTVYRSDEKAFPDKFIANYVGKLYMFKGTDETYATEVISMGLEHFISPERMAKLALEDYEHFTMILGLIS